MEGSRSDAHFGPLYPNCLHHRPHLGVFRSLLSSRRWRVREPPGTASMARLERLRFTQNGHTGTPASLGGPTVLRSAICSVGCARISLMMAPVGSSSSSIASSSSRSLTPSAWARSSSADCRRSRSSATTRSSAWPRAAVCSRTISMSICFGRSESTALAMSARATPMITACLRSSDILSASSALGERTRSLGTSAESGARMASAMRRGPRKRRRGTGVKASVSRRCQLSRPSKRQGFGRGCLGAAVSRPGVRRVAATLTCW